MVSNSSSPLFSSRSPVDAFALSLAFVLSREGGISDDPADSGGLTKYGISQAAYPHEDIRALTMERAGEIYRRDYWDGLRLDQLPALISLAVFDAAVNCGRSAAGRQLQQAVNALWAEPPLVVDGSIGPATINSVQRLDRMDMLSALASELILCRVQYYSDLCARKPDQSKFLRGWIARVIALRQAIRSVA